MILPMNRANRLVGRILAIVAGSAALQAGAAAADAETLLARLLDTPAPTPAWAKARISHDIPPMSDMSAGMLATLAIEQPTGSVRYAVYLTSAHAQKDFARVATAPNEPAAVPMREAAFAYWQGPAMRCGEATLAGAPRRLVHICAARHATQPLIVRAIEIAGAGAQERAAQHVVEAMRHAELLAAAASPARVEPGVMLYRALRTLPIPRSKALSEKLAGLSIVEEEVNAASRDYGVTGRLVMEDRGITVRYVVFGPAGRMAAWYERAVAAPYRGYQLVKSSPLREDGRDQSLRDPFVSRLWATTRGDVMCDVVAVHRSLPLGLRVVLPLPKATVERVSRRSGTYRVTADMFDEVSCMFMAVELGSWASERSTR